MLSHQRNLINSKFICAAMMIFFISYSGSSTNAAGSEILKRGVKLLDNLFSSAPGPRQGNPWKPSAKRYNSFLPSDGAPVSAKYPPGMWKVVSQYVETDSLSGKQLGELSQAYNTFYRMQKSEIDQYFYLQRGTENVELQNEKQKILEISFNYQDILIGALFNESSDPIFDFSINVPRLRYSKRMILKIRSCIRLAKNVNPNRDQLAKQIIEQLNKCRTIETDKFTIASIQFDTDNMLLHFDLLRRRDKTASLVQVDVNLLISRLQNAAFDQKGYVYAEGTPSKNRIRNHLASLNTVCSTKSFAEKTGCMPFPNQNDRYKLRQCIWAKAFVSSSHFPKSVHPIEISCN